MPSHRILILFLAFEMSGPDPEAGIIKLNATQRLLKIDSYRPLDSAAYLLSEDYQIHVNAEDPEFACEDDVLNSRAERISALASDHAYLPKGGALQVSYSVDARLQPLDVGALLQQIVRTYNDHFSFRYRLQTDGDVFTFVPVSGRNRRCQNSQLTAMLDQKISIPKADKPTYENLRRFEEAMSLRVQEPVKLNTQSWMNRAIPTHFTLEARDEPAGQVLLRIIKITHHRFYWLAREQPLQQGWSINLQPLSTRVVTGAGGYVSQWILWPGAKPLPPNPVPELTQPRPKRN